jgi:hypothetical protein
MLNHVPVLSTFIGLVLLGFGIRNRQENMTSFSLGLFLLTALVAIPVFLTGYFAQQFVLDDEGTTVAWIARHQDLALLALILMTATGVVAWLGLWQARQFSQIASWNRNTVMVLALLSLVAMSWTATTGGEIRHPEIRSAELSAPAAETDEPQGWSASIQNYVEQNSWVWPGLEAVHFIGMALIIGVALAVNLRVLGIARSVPFAAFHQLLPLGLLGFLVNVMSGVVFVITAPDQYANNWALHVKILLIMLAGVNVLYYTLATQPWSLGSGDDAPASDKIIACVTLGLWLGVVFLGRMMPYISFNLDL